MTQFEKITESPEVLAAFLAALPVIDGPWDKEFQKRFCAGCAATDCDACPHAAERNNPVWWLSLSAGPDVKPGTVVIDLDPAEPEKPMTAEEKEEMERMRPMFRYFISDSEELTESEISEMEATEEEKAVCRFLAKHNPENRVIEVGMLGKTSILLHGAADVETFITLIRDQSRTAFHSGQ